MNHYFIANEALPVNERELRFTFKPSNNEQSFNAVNEEGRGNTVTGKAVSLSFITNAGLFSHKEIDYASQLLMGNIPAPPAGSSLLDLGCGYGAIGITLAKAYGLTLTMCDVNEIAVRYAKANAALNNVAADVFSSDCFSGVRGAYDIIVTNPPVHAGKETVFRIYKEAVEHLTEGGAFYTVIQKKHGAESHAVYLSQIFNSVETVYRKKGYFIMLSSS